MLVEGRVGGVGVFPCSLLKTQAGGSTVAQATLGVKIQVVQGKKACGRSHMGDFNWPSLGMAYRDMLILLRMPLTT